MKIALIGYGKMGHEIEKTALKRGHEIICKIDINNPEDIHSDKFRSADIAIEFSRPDCAIENYRNCFKENVPVVAGTTGWLEHMDEVKEACKNGQTFFYSSNYSIGVNILFYMNKKLASIMNNYENYDVKIKEIHHTQKLDAPSGTAITLAEDIIDNLERKENWVNEPTCKKKEIAIESVREGTVPGFHEITYDSEVDTIKISHNAKSRTGLAFGAVLAAEYTVEKKGFLTMSDLLKF